MSAIKSFLIKIYNRIKYFNTDTLKWRDYIFYLVNDLTTKHISY
jgi:hypothetical protein